MSDQRMRHNSIFDSIMYTVHRNSRTIGYIIFSVIVCVSIVGAYMMWMKKCNTSAQNYFGMLAIEYDNMRNKQDADFSELLAKFEKGFEQHARASITPFYKNYAVKILLEQNNNEQALALLDDMIIQVSSDLAPLYAMERALIELDVRDGETQKNAENSLRALAYDTTNQFRDAALFYLGRYYWTNDNLDQAREVWQTLVNEQADEKAAPSPWAEQVKEQLALTIV